MDQLVEFVIKGDIARLKEYLAKNPSQTFTKQQPSTEKGSLLLLAASTGHPDIIDILLKQANTQINAIDADGNTALHLASKASDMESVRLLVAAGANLSAVNSAGKKPIDLVSRDNDIKNFLADRMGDPVTTRSIQMARIEFLRQIEGELPTTVSGIKSFILEMLSANQIFQERCKDKIRELIVEKHQAYYKYRLLENAKQTKGNYLTQVQTQQHINEEQAATISYLQIQNSMAEPASIRLEESYRKSLSELSDQQAQELKQISDRAIESEQRLKEALKQAKSELEGLINERENFVSNPKAVSAFIPANDSQYFQKVQTENLALQARFKEFLHDRQTLFDKFKTAEQMKLLHERELVKIKNDTNFNRKIMQETMTKVSNESKPVSDEQDESSGQIVFVRGENGSKQVKGATVEKLIERMTQQTVYDAPFQAAFLLTFRSFTTPVYVLENLMKRFRETDVGINTSMTTQSVQHPAHLRICKVIKSWIENYFEDFRANKDGVLDILNAFIKELESNDKSKLAPIIKNALNRKIGANRDDVPEKKISNQPKPKPLLPRALTKKITGGGDFEKTSTMTLVSVSTLTSKDKSSTKSTFGFGKPKTIEDEYKLTDLEPLEIARQLTLIEYELFTAVKPTEFLDQAWMKEDKEIRAPNICQMTKWSNHITYWLVSEIVSTKDSIKSRALIYERIIMIAHHLEKMNNFNGVKEVLAALQSSSVYRLKKTQENVGGKYMKIYENLMKLTSIEFNFKNLRSKVHASDPPLIPFPGIYQSDLVFMDTCNKSKLDNGLINFMKHQKIASYILELQVYQQTPYYFEYVPEIAEYVRNYPVLDENEAYNSSLICEPRGS